MIYYSIKPGDTIESLSSQYDVPVSSLLNVNPGINSLHLPAGERIVIPAEHFSVGREEVNPRLGLSSSAFRLYGDLRSLWVQNSEWTRLAIVSALSNSPDSNDVINRLLRNASEMAGALRTIYGSANADTFGRLLHHHLVTALQFVSAAKQGNIQAANELEENWYHSADTIAEFLHEINPFLKPETFRIMLYAYLALTKDELTYRLNRNYEKEIALYDRIEEKASRLSEAMADAIIKQFPDVYS